MFRLVLCVLTLHAASFSAFAQNDRQDWTRVFNQAFSFEFETPRAVFLPIATEAADSYAFGSRDGRASLYVLALNANGKSLKDIKDGYVSTLTDAQTTYEQPLRDAIVASGFKQGRIFYLRVALSSDGSRAAILDLTYPEDLKRDFDPIVTRISRSFRFVE